ncbi:hypothetical protein B0H14DRAFT_2651938 [Mycena olivaceomarginata]|nr:hypothetical protein B0H14DRAFT_2651938 [Mycena olivaceomarginata]
MSGESRPAPASFLEICQKLPEFIDFLFKGVDYQGGAESIYKSVKIRVELGREREAGPHLMRADGEGKRKAAGGPGGTVSDNVASMYDRRVEDARYEALLLPTANVIEFIEGERPAYACQYIFMGAGYVGRMGREVEQFRTMGDCAPSWGRSGRELDTRVGRAQKLPPD